MKRGVAENRSARSLLTEVTQPKLTKVTNLTQLLMEIWARIGVPELTWSRNSILVVLLFLGCEGGQDGRNRLTKVLQIH